VVDWYNKKLSDFLSQRKEQIIIQDQTEYSLVTISNKGEVKLREKKKGALISAKKAYITKYGDFIYSRLSVHTGAFGIVPLELDQALITNEMPCFEIDEEQIHPRILINLMGLPKFLWRLKQLTKGMGRVRIKENMILMSPVLLPPKKEQERLVEKIDAVKCYQINLLTELTYQQTLLKKLRQSILQEAIEGKLTADWRKQNPDVEPASELLKRIQEEKEQLIKDKKIKKQKPLTPISEEEKPFKLPEGWEWTSIGEITNVITSGSRNWKSLYSKSGCSFIRSQDIKLDRLRYANRVYVNVSKGAEGTRTSVNKGDWLITITGANVAKCAYLTDDPGEAYVSQHVGLMRPTINEIGPFGHLWLIAEYGGRGLLSSFIYGDKPGLNLPQLRNLLIPLPPLKEQKAIVAKVEKLLATCDQLEQQITTAKTHSEQLMQAVLKEAFQRDGTVKSP